MGSQFHNPTRPGFPLNKNSTPRGEGVGGIYIALFFDMSLQVLYFIFRIVILWMLMPGMYGNGWDWIGG